MDSDFSRLRSLRLFNARHCTQSLNIKDTQTTAAQIRSISLSKATAIKKLLGDSLILRDGSTISSSSLPPIVGLYLAAYDNEGCQSFNPLLLSAYHALKGRDVAFEFILISMDRKKEQFDQQFSENPFPTLPYENVEGARQFKPVQLPQLLMLDSITGSCININAANQLREDVAGLAFPWPAKPKPKPFEVLKGSVLQHGSSEQIDLESEIVGKTTVILFFSASWCGSCVEYSPKLASTYQKLKAKGEELEIIYMPFDEDSASFEQYWAKQPWLSFPFGDSRIKAIQSAFKVSQFPTMVVISKEGEIISTDARPDAELDPEGLRFPWPRGPKQPIEELTLEISNHLESVPCFLLMMDKVYDEAKRTELLDVVWPYAQEVFGNPCPEYLVDKRMQFRCASPVEAGGYVTAAKRIRIMADLPDVEEPDPRPRIVLFDWSFDKPGSPVYATELGQEISVATVRAFLDGFKAGTLTPLQPK